MNTADIMSIRILPNSDKIFPTEPDFRYFIENTLPQREGKYYFPSQMMHCPLNTLVLFQYHSMIRAVGILIDSKKQPFTDSLGYEYAGHYTFDVKSLEYLDSPINIEALNQTCPDAKPFKQVKQDISLDSIDDLLDLLAKTNNVILDDGKAIIKDIEKKLLKGEEKKAIVNMRVNQGAFRKLLLKKHSSCCLCSVCNPALLIASHIKPWHASEPEEKLDEENGFLLCPNHDSIFDKGLISFDDNGQIMISPNLSSIDLATLNLNGTEKINLTEKNKEYLQYHRNLVFQE